jgi:hypothetical protein
MNRTERRAQASRYCDLHRVSQLSAGMRRNGEDGFLIIPTSGAPNTLGRRNDDGMKRAPFLYTHNPTTGGVTRTFALPR